MSPDGVEDKQAQIRELGYYQVADAKRILVLEEEMKYANSIFPTHFDNIVRYKKRWWDGIPITLFAYNGKRVLLNEVSTCLKMVPSNLSIFPDIAQDSLL